MVRCIATCNHADSSSFHSFFFLLFIGGGGGGGGGWYGMEGKTGVICNFNK